MKIKFHLILILLGMTLQLPSQICDGNIGENIFTEGDFGSGAANVLLPDPQIAPGYNYQPNPPPNDGFYTITNNTTSWGSFASNWADIADNSSDPNGYMMVVNASFTPGLFYEQEVEGLCENTLYVFSADVFNLITGVGAIKPNVSFLLNGTVLYQTGDIPTNQQWNTYGFTFTTEPGQTSIILALRNNAPGGGGNDLALDNITFRPCGPEALILPTEIANICEDGSPIELEATIIGSQYDTPVVQWQQSFDEGLTWVDIAGANDSTYTHTNLAGGFYYYRYLLANDPGNLLNSKCRVVSNIKIVHVVPKFYAIVDTLCQGLTFSLGNNLYSNTGIYTDSLTTFIGCDSIVTLDLTIVPDAGIEALFNLDSPSCSYLQDGSILIDTIINGTAPFLIYLNNELDPNAGNILNVGSGDYFYLISDKYGCSFETTVSLLNPPLFAVDLGPDLEIELGESLQLSPFSTQSIENYIWEPADLIECNVDCETLDWTPPNSMILSLSATSSEGCVSSDTLNVTVNNVRKVYIPNVFSPNFDGVNDNFTIFGALPNVQEIMELKVFDRWGGILFEQYNFPPNELASGWNGTSKGKTLDPGIYAYIAKIRFLDNVHIIYEGGISLLK